MKLSRPSQGIVAMSALQQLGSRRDFVYVSNRETARSARTACRPTERSSPRATQAGKVVIPMAVSPNRRLLYAASRSNRIRARLRDRPGIGALKPLSTAPSRRASVHLVDRNGRFLFGAPMPAPGSVNAVAATGAFWRSLAGDHGPQPHSILVTRPTATSTSEPRHDQIFQFVFDEKSGRSPLTRPGRANETRTPRHFIFRRQQVRVLLSELVAT